MKIFASILDFKTNFFCLVENTTVENLIYKRKWASKDKCAPVSFLLKIPKFQKK